MLANAQKEPEHLRNFPNPNAGESVPSNYQPPQSYGPPPQGRGPYDGYGGAPPNMRPYGGPPQALLPQMEPLYCYTAPVTIVTYVHLSMQLDNTRSNNDQEGVSWGICFERLKTAHSMCSKTSQTVLCVPGCRVGGVPHHPHRAIGEGLRQAAGGRRSNKSIDQTMARLQGSTGRPLGSGEDHHLKVHRSIYPPYISILQEFMIIKGQRRGLSELPRCTTLKSVLPCGEIVSLWSVTIHSQY